MMYGRFVAWLILRPTPKSFLGGVYTNFPSFSPKTDSICSTPERDSKNLAVKNLLSLSRVEQIESVFGEKLGKFI